MKQITVYLNVGLSGCKRTETLEVDDDLSDEEIEEVARDVMFNMMEWGWYEGPEKKGRWDP